VKAYGCVSIQAVYLIVGGAGDKSELYAVQGSRIFGIGFARPHPKGHDGDENNPKNDFKLFHDAKLRYIFHFRCV